MKRMLIISPDQLHRLRGESHDLDTVTRDREEGMREVLKGTPTLEKLEEYKRLLQRYIQVHEKEKNAPFEMHMEPSPITIPVSSASEPPATKAKKRTVQSRKKRVPNLRIQSTYSPLKTRLQRAALLREKKDRATSSWLKTRLR